MNNSFYSDFLDASRQLLNDNREKLQLVYHKEQNTYIISKQRYYNEPEMTPEAIDEMLHKIGNTLQGRDDVKIQHGVAFFFQKRWINLLLKNKPDTTQFDAIFKTCFHRLSLSIFLRVVEHKYPQYGLQSLNYCYLQPNPDPSMQNKGGDEANELKTIFRWATYNQLKPTDLKVPLLNFLQNHQALQSSSDYFNRVNQVEVFGYIKNIFPANEWKDFKQYFPTIIADNTESTKNHNIFTEPIKNVALSLSYTALQQKYDIFLSRTDTNNGINWVIDTIDRNKEVLGIDNIYVMENKEHITIFSELENNKSLLQQTLAEIIETLVEFYATESVKPLSKIETYPKADLDQIFQPLFSSIMLMNDLRNELPEQTAKSMRRKI